MDFNQFMSSISENPWMRQLAILIGAIVLAFLVRLLFAQRDQRLHTEDHRQRSTTRLQPR